MHKVRTATQHLVEQPLSAISKIVNLYGFVSLSHHYGGIFTTLLQFTEVWGHLFMHSSLTTFGLWLDNCNTLILLQICCDTWHHCPVPKTLRQMASHLTIEYFDVQRSLWQWQQGAQFLWLQKPKLPPPPRPSLLAISMKCLSYILFSANVPLCILSKHVLFDLVCPRDIVPELLWVMQMQLCKAFFLEVGCFTPGNPSNQATLIQCFVFSCFHELSHLGW